MSRPSPLPRDMTLREYKEWIEDPRHRQASLPSFFRGGRERTINVLEGDAQARSIDKRNSFGARHYAQYKKKPTERRAIALRNWGFRVRIPREE